MEIFVNGAKADVTLDTEKNLGDVLKSFESECEKNNATTINIVVNGTELKSEDFQQINIYKNQCKANRHHVFFM